MRRLRHSTLTLRLVVGFAVGLALGLFLGPKASPLGEAGRWIIGWVKLLAGPFLFFTIVRSLVTTPLSGRSARRLVALTSVNALFALVIGVGLTTWLEPGRHLTGLSTAGKDWKPPTWSLEAWVKGLVPKSVFEPFTENAILPLALCGVAVAIALRRSIDGLGDDESERVRRSTASWLAVAQGLFQTMLGWVVELAPIAVAGVVAKAVGENGLGALGGLWAYLGVGTLGLSLQVGVVYLLWVRWSGVGLGRFWRAVKRPVANAIGTNSSLATLPLTLEALDELGVSKEASTLGACVGTNLNNDGILLYEAMAVLMVAQATGVPLGLGAKLGIVGLCWVATVGIAGVPEAGIISLSIVLTQAGLPLELLPVLLSVDWILARLRSVTNVVSDVVTSLVLDRWMQKDRARGADGPA